VSVKIRTAKARYARAFVAMVVVALGAAHVDKAAASVRANEVGAAQASVATSQSPAAGKILGGVTHQGGAVVVAVSHNQKHVAVLVVLRMSCTSGASFMTQVGWSVPVHGNGVVHSQRAIPASPGSPNYAAVTGGSRSLNGLLNRKRATFVGYTDMQMSFTLSTGQADSCDSGLTSFGTSL
jgi:hypothetical protein